MSTARSVVTVVNQLKSIPTPLAAVLAIALLVSFAYAVLVAQILTWFIAVGTLVTIGLSIYLVTLFYRLVVAVERIADQQ